MKLKEVLPILNRGECIGIYRYRKGTDEHQLSEQEQIFYNGDGTPFNDGLTPEILMENAALMERDVVAIEAVDSCYSNEGFYGIAIVLK